jgi:isocitrate dehydrogenase
VVRENVEDLYAGIEHMQTPGVAQCLKLISRQGLREDRAPRLRAGARRGPAKVALRDQVQHHEAHRGHAEAHLRGDRPRIPDIEAWHIIIDNCAHQLVKNPEQFDVIVTTNMNGDIISDLTSALIGGLGFAPSANIGNEVAIFEAVHGSAPKYAGKNVINPTAVILSAVMMLRYLGEFEAAAAIEHASWSRWKRARCARATWSGYDNAASTTEYTDAIIANLGKKPSTAFVREYRPIQLPQVTCDPVRVRPRRGVWWAWMCLWSSTDARTAGQGAGSSWWKVALLPQDVSSRGTKVYPPTGAITDVVDHYRCRFMLRDAQGDASDAQILDLVQRVASRFRWMHIEKLQEFDGAQGFTKAQGED